MAPGGQLPVFMPYMVLHIGHSKLSFYKEKKYSKIHLMQIWLKYIYYIFLGTQYFPFFIPCFNLINMKIFCFIFVNMYKFVQISVNKKVLRRLKINRYRTYPNVIVITLLVSQYNFTGFLQTMGYLR